MLGEQHVVRSGCTAFALGSTFMMSPLPAAPHTLGLMHSRQLAVQRRPVARTELWPMGQVSTMADALDLGMLRLPSALAPEFPMDLDLIVPDWLPEVPKQQQARHRSASPLVGASTTALACSGVLWLGSVAPRRLRAQEAAAAGGAADTPGKRLLESTSPKGPLALRLTSASASESESDEDECGPRAGEAGGDDAAEEDAAEAPSSAAKGGSLTSQDSEAAARVRRSARLHRPGSASLAPKARAWPGPCCGGSAAPGTLRGAVMRWGCTRVWQCALGRARGVTPGTLCWRAAQGETQGRAPDRVGWRPQLARPDAAGAPAARAQHASIPLWRSLGACAALALARPPAQGSAVRRVVLAQERRRIKRRIANRESARRVRARRQDMLEEMIEKVGRSPRGWPWAGALRLLPPAGQTRCFQLLAVTGRVVNSAGAMQPSWELACM